MAEISFGRARELSRRRSPTSGVRALAWVRGRDAHRFTRLRTSGLHPSPSGRITAVVVGRERPIETIIRELQEGRDREENFRALFERYYPIVYRFFRRKGFLPEDARDLTQLSDLREAAQFERWLYRIARNMAINEIAARGKKASGDRTVSGSCARACAGAGARGLARPGDGQ